MRRMVCEGPMRGGELGQPLIPRWLRREAGLILSLTPFYMTSHLPGHYVPSRPNLTPQALMAATNLPQYDAEYTRLREEYVEVRSC